MTSFGIIKQLINKHVQDNKEFKARGGDLKISEEDKSLVITFLLKGKQKDVITIGEEQKWPETKCMLDKTISSYVNHDRPHDCNSCKDTIFVVSQCSGCDNFICDDCFVNSTIRGKGIHKCAQCGLESGIIMEQKDLMRHSLSMRIENLERALHINHDPNIVATLNQQLWTLQKLKEV